MPDEKVDAKAGESSEPITEPEGQEQHDDGDAVETNVPWNKDKRFQKFLSKKKDLDEYESLGSPGEVKERLESTGALETHVAWLTQKIERLEGKREEGESKTQEQKDLEKMRREARSALAEVAPEINDVDGLKKAWAGHFASLEVRAIRETSKLMSADGLPTSKQDQAEMQELVAGIIGNDPELLLVYRTAPETAVGEAYGRFKKKYAPTAERKVKADLQAAKEKAKTLPKAHGGGGGTGSPAAGAPKSIKEAYERHRAMMGSTEG